MTWVNPKYPAGSKYGVGFSATIPCGGSCSTAAFVGASWARDSSGYPLSLYLFPDVGYYTTSPYAFQFSNFVQTYPAGELGGLYFPGTPADDVWMLETGFPYSVEVYSGGVKVASLNTQSPGRDIQVSLGSLTYVVEPAQVDVFNYVSRSLITTIPLPAINCQPGNSNCGGFRIAVPWAANSGQAFVCMVDINANASIAVINTNSNTLTTVIPVPYECQSLALSPDGSWLLSHSGGNVVNVINTSTYQVSTATLPVAPGENVGEIAWSPQGRWVYGETTNGKLYLLDTYFNTGTVFFQAPYPQYIRNFVIFKSSPN